MKIIALEPQELCIITSIMKNFPHTVIFGSRIKGTSKKFSDIDLCIKDPITDYEYELLKEAFEQSNLPYFVDLVVYNQVDEQFKKIIDEQAIALQDLISTTVNS